MMQTTIKFVKTGGPNSQMPPGMKMFYDRLMIRRRWCPIQTLSHKL